MARAENAEIIDRFEEFYRDYYRDEIGDLAQKYPNEKRSLHVDWGDLYRFDPDLADDVRAQPEQMLEYAEEALRLYDLPIDVKLGQAHVRICNLAETTGIRDIRADHTGRLIAVRGIVRKATDVRPKIKQAAFECQRCGTLTRIPQSSGGFQEPHECQGCERQGPFEINFDQSEFEDSQKLRVQESPEGLRGGETPQSIDVNVEDDVTGVVTAGDHVKATGILRLEQQGSQQEKSPVFDFYMDGVNVEVEDEQFEDMDISDQDKKEIIELSNEPDIYDRMVGSMAPSIYGYDKQKLAIILQLFSGVTKHLPDSSRIRGDLHLLLIGDPGTGKSQLLQYVKNLSPRSVYTSGKGSSSAGLTAAAVRDDFSDGQQWTLEAGALVLADQGVAAIDELDKMSCVTGDALVHTADGIVPIRDLARRAAESGEIERLDNGRTVRDVDASVWTMTEDGRLVQRSVTAVHEYDAPSSLCEVTLESGESLTATPDHPFFVLEDGERVEREARDLDEDDWVYVPERVHEPASDGGVAATSEPRSVPTDDGLSPARGAILGYIAGDGNVYANWDASSFGIRFTNTEETLLADFERQCREAFDKAPVRYPSEQRDDGVETVRLHGKAQLEELFEAGATIETYEGKTVPEAVTNASPETKAAFVRALADSEGGVDERSVKISSASYDLLLAAKMLLLEFGVRSQIQTRERDERLDNYLLVITADDSLAAFDRHVGFTLERKQRALEAACERTTGDRAIVDVLPESDDVLARARESLRLYQSECGLVDATYCNFETGEANPSLYRAETVLTHFENRVEQADEDRHLLAGDGDCSWDELRTLCDRYHVSQSELAAGTDYGQPRVSERWGEDERLRETVAERLRTILRGVAGTDLSQLRDLVRGDVRWRRVTSVERTTPTPSDDDRVPILEGRLVDLVGERDADRAALRQRARDLVERRWTPETWADLRSELERYDVSLQELARELGVDGSTVSRWTNGVTQPEETTFEAVRETALELVDAKRAEIADVLAEIDERERPPKVYDLTVEGTHNFLANGMVVHNSDDQSAMHQALEQQEISVSKAGINATLKSRCSLLGAANPIHGRFDEYEPFAEQIDLAPPLISRFDLIFTVTDQPDEEEDRALAEHIIETNYAGELQTHRRENETPDVSAEQVESVTEDVEPVIEPDLLRKYIAHAKRSCHPTMSEPAKEAIREFYVDLRLEGQSDDNPVPVTARKLEALVRLAEASARVRLSDTVEEKDAERVIEVVRSSLEDVGVDPETGELDADIIESGTSKSQRDRIRNLKGIIEEIENEYEDGAPVEEVLDRAEEIDMERSKAEHEIEKLKRQGEVYEPSTDSLRTT